MNKRELMTKCIDDKWSKYLDGSEQTVTIKGMLNCAACRLYSYDDRATCGPDCSLCPIKLHVGEKFCKKTPFNLVNDFVNGDACRFELHAELTAAIQIEIDFLNEVGNA